MSIKNAIVGLFDDKSSNQDSPDTDKRNEIKKSLFLSKRLIVLIGIGCLMYFMTKGLFTKENFEGLISLAKVYIIGETVTEMFRMAMNGWIKKTEITAAYADGKLDDNELKLLSQTKTAEEKQQ